MADKPTVRVKLDENGVAHVELDKEPEPDASELVASKPDEPTVAAFRDEEFRATQHIRHGGV